MWVLSWKEKTYRFSSENAPSCKAPKMKILLVQPPVRDFYQTEIRIQPIGLAYLAAHLIREGFEAEILDCQGSKKKISLEIPEKFRFLDEYYRPTKKDPFKLFSHFYHFGILYEQIEHIIAQSRSAAVGISAMFTPYIQEALAVAKIAKALDPYRPIVVGGAHVSSCAEKVLESNYVDYVIMGEGEERLSSLMDCLQSARFDKIESVDGLGYKLKNKPHLNPVQKCIENLDSLPFPARHLLDLDRYLIGQKRSTMLMTSRGCPHSCRYCSVHLHMGKTYRKRTAENVLEEIIECYDKLGITIFDIEDDNFTFDRKRAERILDLILEHFGTGKLTLMAMNGLSAHSLDKNLLEKLHKAGLNNLNLSLASNIEKIRRYMDRPGTSQEFSAIITQGKHYGYRMTVYSIIGLPHQTKEEMLETLIYIMEKPVIIGPSIFYPVPGTDLFRECLESGFIQEDDYASFRSSVFPIQTKEFSRRDLITVFQLTRIINYIKRMLDTITVPKTPMTELTPTCTKEFGRNSAGVSPEKFIRLDKNKSVVTGSISRKPSTSALNLQEFFSLLDKRGILQSFNTQDCSVIKEFELCLATSLTQREIGLVLLSIFFHSHTYYSLNQKAASNGPEYIRYTLKPVNYTKDVIESFFDLAKGKRIQATSTDISLTL